MWGGQQKGTVYITRRRRVSIFDSHSVWQRETEQVASSADGHILNSVYRIGHGRRTERLPRIEVPERLARLGIDGLKGLGVVAKKNQSTRRRKRSSPRVAMTRLGIPPHLFPVRRRERQQHLLRVFIRRTLRTSSVESLSLGKRLRLCKVEVAIFESHRIKKACVRIVRGRKPVRCTNDARTNIRAFVRRNETG